MKRLTFIFALGTAAMLSACVVVPAHRGYYEGGYAAPAVIVDAAPPPPNVEVVPVMPYPGAVWINGYWGWNGSRRPGYRWEPHRWENRGGRWHLHAGAWVRL